jgi:hypothetical protein
MLALLLSANQSSANPSASEAVAPTPVMMEAASVVQKKLLAPLAIHDAAESRFMRALLPPLARRVRILDSQPRKDARGGAFVSFAVDARHGYLKTLENDAKRWYRDAITGCVYLGDGTIFVKRGDGFRPGEFLLGKKSPAAAEYVCKGEPAQVARGD